MSANVSTLEESIDRNASAFLAQVQSWVYRGARSECGDFPILDVARPDFYRYRSHERALVSSIREMLVNPILFDLFQLHGYSVEQVKPRLRLSMASNEWFEDMVGVEFVTTVDGQRLGIRYTDVLTGDQTLIDVSRRYQLSKVLSVDWSDSPEARCIARRPASDSWPFKVESVSIREMFRRFFSVAEFETFLSAAREAVEKANDIIGMQAVTRLSLDRTASFRAEVLGELRAARGTVGECVPASHEKMGRPFGSLSDDDRRTLDETYYGEGLRYALVGSSGFARCFVTAEYLRKAFSRGGCFDYTSIVCGYLKSIEQLADTLMRYRLSSPCRRDLFIKKKPRKMPRVGPIQGRRPYKMGKSDHVTFEPENEECFDTSLGSLANFLNDDTEAWALSQSGRHYVLWVLRQYVRDCRNSHFHKDNIDSLAEVERIRGNTLLAAYLLLGGYRGGAAEIPLQEWLGIDREAIEYDRLFNRMEGVPRGCRRLRLEFADGASIYAVRPFERQLIEHDESGNIVTPLLFMRTTGRDTIVPDRVRLEDCDVLVTKENMPKSIWFIRHDGREVFIA